MKKNQSVKKINIRLLFLALIGLLISCNRSDNTEPVSGIKLFEAKKGDRGTTDFVFGNNELTDVVVERQINRLSGISHDYCLTPRDPKPSEKVTIKMSVGPGVDTKNAWCYYSTDGSNPEGAKGVAKNGKAVPFKQVNLEWNDLLWGYITHFEAIIPGQPDGTLVRYIIECGEKYANGKEGSEGSTTPDPFFAFPVDTWETPDWIHDAVMYYVMPDRFYPGNGRNWIQTDDKSKHMGGTLKGIKQKLDYIQKMGFNSLWLMPWMQGPEYHKYGASDFYAIDPHFGTEQDLKDLIDDAHSRGMHVLVDFVANHCSNEHPYFKDALANTNSKYRDWFEFHDDGTYEAFFGGTALPHLVNENPEVRKYIFDLAAHWVNDYRLDGFDLDYAIGPSHEFWATFGRAMRQLSNNVVIFTEGVTTPRSLLTYMGLVDGCQDFAFCQAIRKTFAYDKMDVRQFERFLSRSEDYFPKGFIAPVMIDNQNMDRFLFVSNNDTRRLKIASACLYSMSRPISIWAGTEMGMTQKASAAKSDLNASRNATTWDNVDTEVLNWFKKLGKIRDGHKSLSRGKRNPLISDAETEIFAYEKSTENDCIIVVLNNSDSSREIHLKKAAGCRDILNGYIVNTIKGEGIIKLPARSAAYLAHHK